MKTEDPTRRKMLSLAAGAVVAPELIGGALAQPAVDQGRSDPPVRGEYKIRAGYLLTMDPSIPDLAGGELHVRDGAIVAIGKNLDLPSVPVLDATQMILFPGFVDTHWHLWNCLLKGIIRSGDPKSSYFPLTQRAGPLYTPEDSRRAVRLGVIEGLASGITTVHDWSHNVRTPEYADAELSGLLSTGIRARFSYGWGMNVPLTQVMNMHDVAGIQRAWTGRSNLLTVGMALRSAVATERGVAAIEAVREDIRGGRQLGLPLTMHMGRGGTAKLAEENLLGPDLQLVHPLGLHSDECQALARSKTKVSISPSTEMGSMIVTGGQLNYAELADLNVQLALSLDTTGTSGNADFFSCMRGLMWSHNQRTDTKGPLTLRRLLELATIEGARQLGLESRVGSLTPGKRADLVMVRTTDANVAPVFDPLRAIVLSASPSNVDTVIVDGVIIRRGGRFVTLDEKEIVREATEAAQRIRADLS